MVEALTDHEPQAASTLVVQQYMAGHATRWRPGRLPCRYPGAADKLVAAGFGGGHCLRPAGVPVTVADQLVEVTLPPGMADRVKDCVGAREHGRCSDRHA